MIIKPKGGLFKAMPRHIGLGAGDRVISSGGEDFTDDAVGKQAISWWMFEEADTPSYDGNTTNANDLTWTNCAQSATHKQGSYSISMATTAHQAARFYADLSANFPFKAATTGFTIGGWIYYKANPNYQTVNFSNYSSTGFWLWASSSKPRWMVYTSGGRKDMNANSAITADGWHHCVCRWNGENVSGAGANDELTFWLDGTCQTEKPTTTSVALETSQTFYFNGSATSGILFDEWWIFDIALTDAEILSIYTYGLKGTR